MKAAATRRASGMNIKPQDKSNPPLKKVGTITEAFVAPAPQGLKYETIVRSFTSSHVMEFCESLCYKAWVEATTEQANQLEDLDEESTLSTVGKEDKAVDDRIFEALYNKRLAALKSQMRPRCEESFSAVVMADVSGYSNLSSTLAEKGAEGAEILSKTMKGYLDKIIGIVLDHGGDIVKFAGDAVIFYWRIPLDDDEAMFNAAKGEIVLKAANCCLDLLKQLGSYEVQIPDIGSKILRIHLGIGAGNYFDVMVGGKNRWEHFIGGDAVNQLASVLDLAKAGELALSHQALKCFSSIVDIASVGIGSYDKRCIILTGLEAAKMKNNKAFKKGAAALSDDPNASIRRRKMSELSETGEVIEIIQPAVLPDLVTQAATELCTLFVNPAALYKLQTDINQSKLFKVDAGLIDLMSLRESRQVTTLFIRVGSLTKWDSAATLLLAQEAIMIVQEAITKYEGSLRQAHVDDKGATILVFFGLPPLSHENDASYGLNAGLEIWSKMRNVMDDFSIGITTGIVSIGGVGNESRVEYAVMGDAINMAARLMCSPKCNGILLCDEKTYNLCENEFSFENLGLLKVKGKAHPINIYQPKEAKEKTVQLAITTEAEVFLGREKERAMLSKLLDTHVNTSGPRIMIMEAEGGMGLSTLARWTEKVAKDRHLCVASGRNSTQTEKNTRYFIWQEIVKDLIIAIEAMPVNEARIKTAAEPRVPLFLMTQKDGTSKDRGSAQASKMGGKSTMGGGTKSMMTSMRPKGRIAGLGDGGSVLKSKSNEKVPPKLSVIQGSTGQGSMASSGRTRAAASRQRQMVATVNPGEEAAPPFHTAASQDLGGSRGINTQNGAAMKKWLEFEEKLKSALTKAGESPNQAAIMNLVYPFDFSQTEVYTKLQGKFRINELTDLIRRLINEISEWKPLVITIHDSQWIDQLAWEMLWELAMSCPKLMICLFSRPEKYHESVETKMQYQKFKRHQQAEFLNLEGLVTEDVEKLISANWVSSDKEIKSVSENIVSNIQKRTAGNPLYIKSALVALKESGKFSVTDYGELTLNSGEFDFEKSISLVDNLQSVITSQLDRLDSNFQLFLKVASVLGQPFLIEDALNLLNETPMFEELANKVKDEPETIDAFIKSMDKYEYLTRIDNIDAEQFQFKSSLVKECIYNMMLQNQRQLLHLNVATYYEQIIDSGNQQRLFLALYEHYSKADEVHTMKKLTYLQIMAHIYFERNSIGEAIKHYKMLLLAVEKHPKHIKITFDDVAKGSWHRELGEAYFQRGEASKAEKHLLESLKINSYKFPNTWWSLRVKTAKEWKTRSKWPILLAGDVDLTSGLTSGLPDLQTESDNYTGSRDSLGLDEHEARTNDITDILTDEMQFDPMAIELAEIIRDKEYAKLHNIRRSMACLGMLYLNTGRYKDCIYAINCATNISELFPRDGFYAKLMALNGIISWTEGAKKKDTLRYLESASKHDQRFDLVQTVSIVLKSAQAFFFMGKWGSAIRRLGLLPALEMMSGDFQLRLDALRMRAVIIHLCGARPQSLKAAKALFYIATQEDNWEGQLWGCKMILANYLNIMKANNDLPEYAARLKGIWERRPAKIKFDPTLNLNYLALMTRVKLRTEIESFSVDAFLKKFHSIILEMQRPSPKKYSEDSFSARGGECNSAGGPLECLSMIGVLHCSVSVLAMWDAKLIKQSHWRQLLRINKDLKKWLTNGNIMQNMTITESMHQLFEGAVLHITSHTTAAIKLWKKGLSGRRVNDLMYVRGLLHLLVACYTDSANNSNHNAHEAQKLFSRIGATVEFDRARAYRKDRKDRSRSEISSQQTGGEMDENFGDSIFGDNDKSFESELDSESN